MFNQSKENIDIRRDIMPPELIAKNKMDRNIKEILRRYGYTPFSSSTFEWPDFFKNNPADKKNRLYRIKDESGADLVLRYNLALPLLRFISEYPKEDLPARCYQKGTVWRNRKQGKSSFKEFVQLFFTIVGAKSLLTQAEIIQITHEILKVCCLKKYTIRLNNQKILLGFLQTLGFTEKDFSKLRKAIDKFYFLGEETFIMSLKDLSIDDKKINEILNFVRLDKGWPKNCEELKERFKDSEQMQNGFTELAELMDFLKKMHIAKGCYRADFSVAKRLSTYSGLIFEVNLEDAYQSPTIMTGGRYDGFMTTYFDCQLPTVGATISFDRLFLAMKEQEIIREKRSPAKALVAVHSFKQSKEMLNIATEMRQRDIYTALYPDFDSIEKQVRYAANKLIPYVVIMEPGQSQAKKLIVKETKNGHEEVVDRHKVAAYIKKKLSS